MWVISQENYLFQAFLCFNFCALSSLNGQASVRVEKYHSRNTYLKTFFIENIAGRNTLGELKNTQ